MTIVCNIWIICWELNRFLYDPSWMLHLSEFVWTLRSSVLVVFNNFLIIDTTDRSNISSNQKPFFIGLSLYPFHFSRTIPFRKILLETLLLIDWIKSSRQIKPEDIKIIVRGCSLILKNLASNNFKRIICLLCHNLTLPSNFRMVNFDNILTYRH